jgi:hypothetical protein
MTVSTDTKWKNKLRDGFNYTIYATDQGGKFPIHGAFQTIFGNWSTIAWETNGTSNRNPGFDLIKAVEDKPKTLIRVILVNGKVFSCKPTLEEIEDAYSTEPMTALTIDDYYDAFNEAWAKHKHGPVYTSKGLFQSGIKAVLKLAGIKVLS